MTYLKLIKNNISLVSTSGKYIAEATNLFNYIDSDFKAWGLDFASSPTDAVQLEVYELIQDATFKQAYESLGQPLENLCLTQAQIIQLVQDHKDLLRKDGYGTFFLMKKDSKFFVVCVYVFSSDELDVGVLGFEDDYVWGGGGGHRVFVPQLQEPKILSTPLTPSPSEPLVTEIQYQGRKYRLVDHD